MKVGKCKVVRNGPYTTWSFAVKLNKKDVRRFDMFIADWKAWKVIGWLRVEL